MISHKLVTSILDQICKNTYDIEHFTSIDCLPAKQRKQLYDAIYETEIHECFAYISDDKRNSFMNSIAEYVSEHMLSEVLERRTQVALNCFDELKIMTLKVLQDDIIKEVNMIIEEYVKDYVTADDYSDGYAAHGVSRWDFF